MSKSDVQWLLGEPFPEPDRNTMTGRDAEIMSMIARGATEISRRSPVKLRHHDVWAASENAVRPRVSADDWARYKNAELSEKGRLLRQSANRSRDTA